IQAVLTYTSPRVGSEAGNMVTIEHCAKPALKSWKARETGSIRSSNPTRVRSRAASTVSTLMLLSPAPHRAHLERQGRRRPQPVLSQSRLVYPRYARGSRSADLRIDLGEE